MSDIHEARIAELEAERDASFLALKAAVRTMDRLITERDKAEVEKEAAFRQGFYAGIVRTDLRMASVWTDLKGAEGLKYCGGEPDYGELDE